MKDQRQKIEDEFYELANCGPLNEEQLERLHALQRKYKRLMSRNCPLKKKIEFRFKGDTTEVEMWDAIEPRIVINPLKEGYILQRVIELNEYHLNKPQPLDVYYMNEDVSFVEPKNKTR